MVWEREDVVVCVVVVVRVAYEAKIEDSFLGVSLADLRPILIVAVNSVFSLTASAPPPPPPPPHPLSLFLFPDLCRWSSGCPLSTAATGLY